VKNTVEYMGWLELAWLDKNLIWNPEDYGNITVNILKKIYIYKNLTNHKNQFISKRFLKGYKSTIKVVVGTR